MIRVMTMDEAIARATQELAPRAAQMTAAELLDAITDRARELAGELPLARLTGGRRLDREQLDALVAGIDAMLSDFTDVAVLGDARIRGGGRRVDVLFRLTHRPDIGHVVGVDRRGTGKVNFREIGEYVAVRAYDYLTEPGRIANMIRSRSV